MRKKMNIVITNVYCYENRGDAGIVLSMIENLKQTFPGAKITVLSLWPEIDKGKYGQDIEVSESPITVCKNKNKYIRSLRNSALLLIKVINYQLGKFDNSEKRIRSADLIVSCGGGYMQCRDLKQFVDGFVYHYIQLYLAKKLKKDYVIFAQTIGPFGDLYKKYMKKIFQQALLVLPREKISYNYVIKEFPEAKTHLTADVAFLLSKEYYDLKTTQNKVNVGITVRSWIYPGYSNRQEMEEKYIQSIVEFVDYLNSQGKYSVYFMPQCVGPKNDNDLIITNKIVNLIKKTESINVLNSEIKPEQLKYCLLYTSPSPRD